MIEQPRVIEQKADDMTELVKYLAEVHGGSCVINISVVEGNVEILSCAKIIKNA